LLCTPLCARKTAVIEVTSASTAEYHRDSGRQGYKPRRLPVIFKPGATITKNIIPNVHKIAPHAKILIFYNEIVLILFPEILKTSNESNMPRPLYPQDISQPLITNLSRKALLIMTRCSTRHHSELVPDECASAVMLWAARNSSTARFALPRNEAKKKCIERERERERQTEKSTKMNLEGLT